MGGLTYVRVEGAKFYIITGAIQLDMSKDEDNVYERASYDRGGY